MHYCCKWLVEFNYVSMSMKQFFSLPIIGSIIRCMRRLEELLRQMCQAAKAIGNTDLENKFAEGTYLVKIS